MPRHFAARHATAAAAISSLVFPRDMAALRCFRRHHFPTFFHQRHAVMLRDTLDDERR